jgi:hypothetical protein
MLPILISVSFAPGSYFFLSHPRGRHQGRNACKRRHYQPMSRIIIFPPQIGLRIWTSITSYHRSHVLQQHVA